LEEYLFFELSTVSIYNAEGIVNFYELCPSEDGIIYESSGHTFSYSEDCK